MARKTDRSMCDCGGRVERDSPDQASFFIYNKPEQLYQKKY